MIGFNHIMERSHISKCFCVPLRLTRLGPEDMAGHKRHLEPLLSEMIPGPLQRQMAMEACFERLERNFRFN